MPLPAHYIQALELLGQVCLEYRLASRRGVGRYSDGRRISFRRFRPGGVKRGNV